MYEVLASSFASVCGTLVEGAVDADWFGFYTKGAKPSTRVHGVRIANFLPTEDTESELRGLS
jgi:hypothetical protein